MKHLLCGTEDDNQQQLLMKGGVVLEQQVMRCLNCAFAYHVTKYKLPIPERAEVDRRDIARYTAIFERFDRDRIIASGERAMVECVSLLMVLNELLLAPSLLLQPTLKERWFPALDAVRIACGRQVMPRLSGGALPVSLILLLVHRDDVIRTWAARVTTKLKARFVDSLQARDAWHLLVRSVTDPAIALNDRFVIRDPVALAPHLCQLLRLCDTLLLDAVFQARNFNAFTQAVWPSNHPAAQRIWIQTCCASLSASRHNHNLAQHPLFFTAFYDCFKQQVYGTQRLCYDYLYQYLSRCGFELVVFKIIADALLTRSHDSPIVMDLCELAHLWIAKFEKPAFDSALSVEAATVLSRCIRALDKYDITLSDETLVVLARVSQGLVSHYTPRACDILATQLKSTRYAQASAVVPKPPEPEVITIDSSPVTSPARMPHAIAQLFADADKSAAQLPPKPPVNAGIQQPTTAAQSKTDDTTSGSGSFKIDRHANNRVLTESGKPAQNRLTAATQAMDAAYLKMLSWNLFQLEEDTDDVLPSIPDRFTTVQEYIRTFEPLVFQECFARVMKDREEIDTDKAVDMNLAMVQRIDQFQMVGFVVDTAQHLHNMDRWSELDLIVLAPMATADQSMEQGLSDCKAGTRPHCLAQLTYVSKKGDQGEVMARLSTTGPYADVLATILKPGTTWYAYYVSSMATIHRELSALQNMHTWPLQPHILDPLLVPIYSTPILMFQKSVLDHVREYQLNESQARAVASIVRRPGLSLVQGPPGTGKTKMILGCIGALLDEAKRVGEQPVPSVMDGKLSQHILVCAPSNAAVDELVRRLRRGIPTGSAQSAGDGHQRRRQVSIVRLGTVEGVHESVKDVTVEQLTDMKMLQDPELVGSEHHLEYAHEYKQLRIRLDQLNRQLNQCYAQLEDEVEEGDEMVTKQIDTMIENLGMEKQQLMNRMNRQFSKSDPTRKLLDRIRQRIRTEILNEAEVILCTLSMSGHDSFSALEHGFKTVIIDEACQAVELDTLIPLQYGAERCVLVGDPNQLPPTILSQVAKDSNLDQSLFARLLKSIEPAQSRLITQSRSTPGQLPAVAIHLLNMQYRMHPFISSFPNQMFYKGQIQDGPEVQDVNDCVWHHHPQNHFPPFKFFNIIGGREERGTTSLKNDEEVQAIVQMIDHLVRAYPCVNFASRIGIITPYRDQKRAIIRALSQHYGRRITSIIEVNTVDGFQGREKQIILFSCVRAQRNPKYGRSALGFLSDVRRLNVALTRAKSSLWVFGHKKSLEGNSVWSNMMMHCQSRKTITDVRLPLYNHRVDPSAPRPQNIYKVPRNATEHLTQVSQAKIGVRRRSSIGLDSPLAVRAVKKLVPEATSQSSNMDFGMGTRSPGPVSAEVSVLVESKSVLPSGHLKHVRRSSETDVPIAPFSRKELMNKPTAEQRMIQQLLPAPPRSVHVPAVPPNTHSQKPQQPASSRQIPPTLNQPGTLLVSKRSASTALSGTSHIRRKPFNDANKRPRTAAAGFDISQLLADVDKTHQEYGPKSAKPEEEVIEVIPFQ